MGIPYDTKLPPDLLAHKLEIEKHARAYGLDFYETIFEVVDAEDLNEIAAYGGFPTRYPHWSFGMQFEELKKGYDYGLSKIYEMVINNDPCYAYLMRCNHTVDQKLVMAHVYGHCLAPETLIETQDGPRPISKVRVGDRVLTHTGAFKRVRAVARRHFVGDILLIRLEGRNETVRITGEHPVGIAGPGHEIKWVEARELGGGMFVAYPRVLAAVGPRPSAIELEPSRWMDREEPHSIRDGRFEWNAILKPETEPYEGYVYNFSVEEDESYTLAAGMVVHNCDFFKNNAYFAHTSRKMMDEMANHGVRVRRYVEKYGEDEVEAFVDRCMSIDDLIDIHSTAIKRREDVSRYDFKEKEDETAKLTRFKSKDYMSDYINPPDVLKAEEEERRKEQEAIQRTFPERPERDVLLFLIEYAPLKPWQRDVLSIVRDEAYYFAPQGMTKIINEGWACMSGNSLILTDRGIRRMAELVEERQKVRVSDGERQRAVYDWARFENRETVKLRTRRGYEVEGSVTHQLLLPGNEWRRLDGLRIGDRVCLSGPGLWASEEVPVTWSQQRRITLREIASQCQVDIETVMRFRDGVKSRRSSPQLIAAVAQYDRNLQTHGLTSKGRRPIRVPKTITEDAASLLGYLTGDGHISVTKRVIGLTTGDEEQADRFQNLVREVFGLECRKKWDENRCRVLFSSNDARDFLVSLGMKTGVCAREKVIPDCILRSPRSVVAAFLRAYFDCDGYAGKQGVILSTASEEMGKQVQLLLLNFGILSSRRGQKDGCWHVHVAGKAAEVFEREIGFGLERKRDKLRAYLASHQWFKEETWEDKVVSLEHGRADVYDISVEETHRYAAQGFINHNSYWHSTIMTERALEPWECVDYADHHSGTMAVSRGRLNPYKLGIELLRDIERRWNTGQFGKEWEECDDIERKRNWDLKLGLGRQKIFEVRKIHNDLTFIDTFLTPEFCQEHKMFSFGYNEQGGNYVIESREFHKVKQRLLFSLTNHGRPFIYVVDGNFRNRGELLLRHEHNGLDLKLDRAADTLANVQALWSRPVHLQTVIDNQPSLLTYDGATHSIKNLGEADDPRKHNPPKTR